MISLLFLLGLAHVWCAALAGCWRLGSEQSALASSRRGPAPAGPSLPEPLGDRPGGCGPCASAPLGPGKVGFVRVNLWHLF